MTFGERLRSARERLGITQLAAAEQSGFHAVTWNKWERNKSAPRGYDVIRRLSDTLHVRYVWLADGEGRMEAPKRKRARTVSP